MSNTAKSPEEQAIERFIAERGVTRLPDAMAAGIGPSRWQPNPYRRCTCEFPAKKILCDYQCTPSKRDP